MAQRAIPAVFMRGGTSKGLMFHERDLPKDRAEWESILCGAMGSPDPFGRQLDGMGGGISSLSKVCVIGPPTRDDADLDYTFVQVMIAERRLDLRSNCGNMSAAVGPFAFDEGLVPGENEQCEVRIHNTNTGKIIRSSFAVDAAHARYDGEFRIPGVSVGGSPVRLDFLDPGGATTGRLLPTGRSLDTLEGVEGSVSVSMIDAANATVFVNAHAVGARGDELPAELDEGSEVFVRIEAIRREASVRMGIAHDLLEAARITSVPFVCLISGPAPSRTLAGATLAASDADLVARVISHGQPHRALPLTVALCTAVAARIDGSVVAAALDAAATRAVSPLRVAMPSGVLEVDASVTGAGQSWTAHSGTFYRTARRLFDGRVWSND